jgi:hypothetical protein
MSTTSPSATASYVKGLLQDTGDENLQMLERGATLNCRGLETRRIQAVFEVDRPW